MTVRSSRPATRPQATRAVAGMTLVEVLIALAIFVLVIAAVGLFEANTFTYQRSVSGSLETAQDSQLILKTMVTQLRDMAPGGNGAYPLISAGTSSMSFFSNTDSDSSEEQVTYYLSSSTLYEAVVQPSGSPPAYTSSAATTTVITNVRNSSSTPIFQYFDSNYTGTSSPLSSPVTIAAVRLIKISLTLDVDPNRSPLPITYTAQVNLRNLKSNL